MARCCQVDVAVFGHQWRCPEGLGPATPPPGWYRQTVPEPPRRDSEAVRILRALREREKAMRRMTDATQSGSAQ